MSLNSNAGLPTPWAEFLEELDALLLGQAQLHCIGGFVISLFYGLPRPTGDIDYNSVSSVYSANDIQEMAGAESALARKYKVHLHYVPVNSIPEDYEARLVEMFPGRFKNLHLYMPDPYDLILSKLERNSSKDRDDVEYLARVLHLNAQLLRERYEKELRPILVNESRHDLTLRLWIDACFQPANEPESGCGLKH
jgi:hypothetical protein